SERNGSKAEPMRFIQMWIMPSRRGLEPSIEQREFSPESRRNRLKPLLVPAPGYANDGAPRATDAVTVHQDAAVYAALLDPRTKVRHEFRPGFGGYLFVVHGSLAKPELDEGAASILPLTCSFPCWRWAASTDLSRRCLGPNCSSPKRASRDSVIPDP